MKKVKISFCLKSGIKTNIPITATISFGYKEFDVKKKDHVYMPVRYYTGIHVEKDEWDFENNKPFNKSKSLELLQFEQKTTEIYNYLKLIGDVTPDLLKCELDQKIKGKNSSKIINRVRIYDFINEDIKNSSLSESTKGNYSTLGWKIRSY